jgi:hypothetical protein
VPQGDLLTASCLGRSVFESASAKGRGGGDAPPLCIGVEWLRYSHAAMQEQAAREATAVAAPAPALPLLAAASTCDRGQGWAARAAGAVEAYFGDRDPLW